MKNRTADSPSTVGKQENYAKVLVTYTSVNQPDIKDLNPTFHVIRNFI